jgi:hypothetical protein
VARATGVGPAAKWRSLSAKDSKRCEFGFTSEGTNHDKSKLKGSFLATQIVVMVIV